MTHYVTEPERFPFRNSGTKMRNYLLAAMLCAVAVPAFAADFTGPRIEARLGFDRFGGSVTSSTATARDHRDGVAYGVGAGYDIAVPGYSSLIVGVEANVDLFSTSVCSPVNGNDQACLKARRDIDLAVRIGGKIAASTLLYVKAGYANSRVRETYSDFTTPANNFSAGANGDGYRLGAGLEYAVTKQVYAKTEYRYTGYGHENVGAFQVGYHRNQIIAAVGVRF